MLSNEKTKQIVKEIITRIQNGENPEYVLAEYPPAMKSVLKKLLTQSLQQTSSPSLPQPHKYTLQNLWQNHAPIIKPILLMLIITLVGLTLYIGLTQQLPLFSSPKPSINLAVSYDVQAFPIDGSFTFDITGSISPALLENALVINPTTEGSFTWLSNTSVSFKPYQNLLPATTYSIAFENSIFPDNVHWEITTVPAFAIVEVSPQDKAIAVPTTVAIRVKFNYASLNFSQFPQHVTITPKVSGTFRYENTNAVFLPAGGLQKETEYQITIKAGLKNSAGETITQDYSWSFITTGDREQDSIDLYGQKIVTESYYNTKHRFSLHYSNLTDPLNITLYQSNLDTLLTDNQLHKDAYDNYTAESISNVNIYTLTIAHTWTEEIQKGPDIQHFFQLPLLDPGIYYLAITHQEKTLVATHVIISKLALVTMQEKDKILLWATDIQNSQPEQEVAITSLSLKEQVEQLQNTTTDQQGIGWVKKQNVDILVGQKDTNIMVVFFPNQKDTQSLYQVYAYTDRPLYEVGQTVYFKALIRKSLAEQFAKLPQGTTATVFLRNNQNWEHTLWSKTLVINEQSSLAGEITLSSSWAPGEYYLHLTIGEETLYFLTSFQIASDLQPTYSLSITSDKSEYVSKEKITLTVKGMHLSGQPLAEQEVTYTVYAENFNPPLTRAYEQDFEVLKYYQKYYPANKWLEGKIKLDQNGETKFSLDSNLKDSLESKVFTIELLYQDSSNIPVIACVSVIVYRGEFDVSFSADQPYNTIINTPLPLTLVSRDHRFNPVPNANLKVTIERIWWEKKKAHEEYDKNTDTVYPVYDYEEKNQQIDYKARQTNSSGLLTFQFTPQQTGQYRITVVGDDTIGNTITFRDYIWCSGTQALPWDEPNTYLTLIADKKEYAPGDQAKVTIFSPRNDGNALIVISTNTQVQSYSLEELGAESLFITIPVTALQIPSITVHAVLTHNNHLYSGTVVLPIQISEKKLLVNIQTDKESYAPGEEAVFSITVTDLQNNPIRTELSLSLVDQAMYLIQGDNTTDLFSAFYKPYYDILALNHSLNSPPSGSKPDQNQGIATIRSLFANTAYWQASLLTDEQGKATAIITLPDNVTTWIATAKGISLETTTPKLGTTYKEITISKDLILQPYLPLFANWQDEIQIQARLQNYSGQADTFVVSLACEELTIQEENTQKLYLENKQAQIITWPVTVKEKKEADLTITAVGENSKLSNSIKQKLPLYPVGFERATSFAGEVNYPSSKTTFEIIDGKTVELRLYPSLAAHLYETLQMLSVSYVRNTEEIAANLLPMILIYQNYEKLGYRDPIWKDHLKTSLETSVSKLYDLQNTDGGWGWFFHDSSDPEITALITYLLIRAKQDQYPIEEKVLENSLIYLEPLMDNATISGNIKTYILYVLTHAGKNYSIKLDLYNQASDLADYAKAFLGLAYLETDQKIKAQTILDELKQKAIYTENAVYWEDIPTDYNQMTAGTFLTTATVMDLLLKLEPNSELIPKILRWLQSNKKSYLWQQTVASSHILIATIDYLLLGNETLSDFMYNVKLNNTTIYTGNSTKNAHEPIFVPITQENLQVTNSLEITKTGKGKLYYYLDQRLYSVDNTSMARNNFILDKTWYSESGTGIQQATVGDLVHVVLTVTNPYNYSYVRLVDFLPAGFEPIIADNVDESWELRKKNYEKQGYTWPTHQDTYSNRVIFYKTFLPQGTHKFTYLVRATIPGTFSSNPAKIELVYIPEIMATSEIKKISIIK